ncbi:MAG: DUF6883 domain-containing protein [Pseudomonadota bacterium]
MPLPNAENAFIDTRKLTDYCLNLEHFEGRHKARVFKSAKPNRLFLLNAIHKVKNMSLTL